MVLPKYQRFSCDHMLPLEMNPGASETGQLQSWHAIELERTSLGTGDVNAIGARCAAVLHAQLRSALPGSGS